MDKYKDCDPLIIYSMWKGYLEEERVKAFIEGYRKVDVHTSGHADIEAIKMLMEITTPDMIIPIHTEVPTAFNGIYNKGKLILLQDGEEFVM
jgi:ribonuclease J